MIFFCFIPVLERTMTPEEKAAFLTECEKKFTKRYTEKDPEYSRVCKTLDQGGSEPPLVVNKPREYDNHNRDYRRDSGGNQNYRRDHRGDNPDYRRQNQESRRDW